MKEIISTKPKLVIQTILFVFLISLAAYPQQLEKYTVGKINTEITIDGVLDEPVWAAAEQTENFVILGDNQNAASTTAWAKILWDENYLYVAFYCQDEYIWATYEDRDDPLYKEDVVEVYIDPDADGKNYLEVEVNPLNTIFDLWLTKPWSDGGQGITAWTMAGLKTAISIDGTVNDNFDQDIGWTCEMAMPFSEMKFAATSMNFPPLENEQWRFNMYRFDRSSTNGSGEATGWSQTNGGQHEPSRFGALTFGELITSVVQMDETNKIINDFSLHQNYPNPFNPSTQIQFSISNETHVNLTVYNMLGQQIKTLVDQHTSSGAHKASWDGKNELGETAPNGAYYYRLQTRFGSRTMKMIMLK